MTSRETYSVAHPFCGYDLLLLFLPMHLQASCELSLSSQFLNLQSLAPPWWSAAVTMSLRQAGPVFPLCFSSSCAFLSWGLIFLLYYALLLPAKVSAQTKQAFKAQSLFPLLFILHCSLFFPENCCSSVSEIAPLRQIASSISHISCSSLKLFDPCYPFLGLLRVRRK